MTIEQKLSVYQEQGFGRRLAAKPPFALLIVDFQVGFADPAKFGGGNIAPAIARTKIALEEARKRSWAVAHSRIVFADDGSDANGFSDKVPNLLQLTESAPISQTVPELRPRQGEIVVRKTLPSAFAGTDLNTWLCHHGIRTVLVAGATTSGCVRASVIDLMNFGFAPFVLTDCVGDRALEPHEANLFDMQQKYAELMTLDMFLAQNP